MPERNPTYSNADELRNDKRFFERLEKVTRRIPAQYRDDVEMDTALHCLTHPRSIPRDRGQMRYLGKIVRCKLSRALTAEARHCEYDDDVSLLQPRHPERRYVRPPFAIPNVSEMVHGVEFNDARKAVLVVLRYQYGFQWPQISDVLGVRVRQCHNLHNQALDTLEENPRIRAYFEEL